MRILAMVATLALAAESAASDGLWTMASPRAWARETGAAKLEVLPDGAFEVRHAGAADWCVNGFPRIPVKHGDVFELTCDTEPLADVPDSRPVGFSAVLRDAKGKEVSWSFGGGHARPGRAIRSAFMVPHGIATIQPRILGTGAAGARVRNVRARRTGNEMPRPATALAAAFGNGQLRGSVGGAAFEVTDRRTGRTWRPAGRKSPEAEEIARTVDGDGTVRMTYIHPESLLRWQAEYRVEKDQTGERYRLPLWELVYHDCVCAHWYWGDYNNKLPGIWWKRDLFNVLYGTMGMYVLDNRRWPEERERFVRSYRMTSPVARATGYSEMTDHRILSADRTVQESRFADGTVVTVNFGDAPFTLPDGTSLPARSHRLGRK